MAKIAPDRRKGTRASLRRIANSLGLPMDRPVNDGLIDHRQIVPTADTGYYIVKVKKERNETINIKGELC